MDLSIFFAGTGGSQPTLRRGMPGAVIRRGSDRILIDCGEGTQRQLVRSVGLAELDEVFITHLHADHWLGLPGLLKTFDLRGRETPLTVHGPRGLAELISDVTKHSGRVSYPLHVNEVQPGEVIERDGYEIAVVPVQHRGTCYAYVLYELERPGVFDPAAARARGVPEGPAWGRLQRGETVDGVSPADVMGPPRPGRKLTFSGDTRPCEALEIAAHGSDVLVHEGTFGIEDAERAHETGHSTGTQAAGLARAAQVKLLALNHISIRYLPRVIRDEAREIFANTVVPRDFDVIDVPLPERGEPELIRWEDQPAEASLGSAT
ncbi:MAG: ribonuclease Z [Solirubrobacterales bacterium]|nr:ribonuclease Z [Solirubrobacterales bacterium]